jgi:chlorite dismutase
MMKGIVGCLQHGQGLSARKILSKTAPFRQCPAFDVAPVVRHAESADYTQQVATETRRGPEPPDISEKGGIKNGQPQRADTRLFMQFLAFGGCHDSRALSHALSVVGLDAVLYEDMNDPRGVALLTFSEDPAFFLDRVRPLLNQAPFGALEQKPEYTMVGRTYAIGYEPDLADVLLHRPRRTVLNPEWPWAVWYPLRRSGRFAQLPAEEQRVILAEHGTIGMSFGAADLAHDVRLACHGLDKSDNDFVVGLIGKALYPLSAVVQAMRKTQQTSLYLERLGPFFVGRAVWQSRARKETRK